MAGKAHPTTPVYEEFEPFCKWQRSYDRDILEIHLQGFVKEELKVQISNQGILKIYGERELGPSKKSKFYKEIQVPSKTYITGAIQAKFATGWLYITMPKVIVTPEKTNGNKTLTSLFESSKNHDDDQMSKQEPAKDEPKQESAKDQPKQDPAKDQPTAVAPPPTLGSVVGGGGPKVPAMGFEFEDGRQSAAKVAMGLAATAMAVAVLVGYVVYMYKSTVD